MWKRGKAAEGGAKMFSKGEEIGRIIRIPLNEAWEE